MRHKSAPLSCLLLALVAMSCQVTSPAESPAPAVTSVDPPAFSLWSGAYIGAQHVTIAAAPGAQVRYTLDGSDPSVSLGAVYSGPVTVDGSKTLKAVSVVKGVGSRVSAAQFLIFLWQGTFSSPPSSPVVGWSYYDSTLGQSRFWDGSSWQVLAMDGKVGAQGLTGIQGPAGSAGQNGVSLVWKGTLSSPPANPQVNWAYYDTTQASSFLWNGTNWDVLAKDGAIGQQGATGQTGAAGTNGLGIVWKGTLTQAPSSPQTNWAYYDSSTAAAYLFDGTTWQILAKDGAAGAQGQTGAPGQDGAGILWKGSQASAPASPHLNWAYYNTVDRTAYLYDGTGWQPMVKDGKDLVLTVAATPFFSLLGGTYSESKSLQILDTTEGVTIYYTLDGSEPSTDVASSSQAYTPGQVIDLDRTRTLRAIAVKAGLASSAIQTQVYAFVVPAPYLVPAGGTYPSVQYPGVFSPAPGASYRYTTDGKTTPTDKVGALLTDPVAVNSNLTLKVVGFRDGWTNSPVVTNHYVIQAPTLNLVATPTFALPDGTTFETSLGVVLADSTPGATVEYSTDGGATWTEGTSLRISATTTILARALKAGMADSAQASATYTKVASTPGRVVQPSVTIATGTTTFSGTTTVTISSDTVGADLWYTLDGSVPTKSLATSYHYTAPFSISNTVTVTAKAFVGTSELSSDSLPNVQTFSVQSVSDLALVSVPGGEFVLGSGQGASTSDFQIGKYEVTYRAWKETRDWAQANGYAIANAGTIHASVQAPVTGLNVADMLAWLNALSERHGLTPVYYTDGPMTAVYRDSTAVTAFYVKTKASGYRLATATEWEYAARNRGARPGDQWAGDTDTWVPFQPYGADLIWKGNLAANPANPQPNWLYNNTNDNKGYVFDGSVWVEITTISFQGAPVTWGGAPGVLGSPLRNAAGFVQVDLTTGKAYAVDSGLDRVAWTTRNTPRSGSYPILQAVGQRKPNELGLYDMTGNAYEVVVKFMPEMYPYSAGSSAFDGIASIGSTSNFNGWWSWLYFVPNGYYGYGFRVAKNP